MMLDRLLSVLLTLAAISIAITLGVREFGPDRRVHETAGGLSFVPEWEQLHDVGHLIGSRDALVKVVEFADLECPFCRRFHHAFDDVRKEVGDDISLTYVHFPLASHRFAEASARASECAARQGRFESFILSVFDAQDSLGVKPFRSFAAAAEVPDLDGFDLCLQSDTVMARIERGLEHGEKLGVRATPTVIVNGWRYSEPPSGMVLRSIVDSVRAVRIAMP